MPDFSFKEFAKIPRLRRGMVITEKVDGTNAQIFIYKTPDTESMDFTDSVWSDISSGIVIRAGSRTRWITPGKKTDNYGFAAWVAEHGKELARLGEGKHFGEWFGQGINRNYGLTERRFALFNVNRWKDGLPEGLPANVGVVPILYQGDFDTSTINDIIWQLHVLGSEIVKGFMKPEGVVIYHTASGQLFKRTIENDEKPKGLVDA